MACGGMLVVRRPALFALSSILAEIRATEPCKRPATDGRHGSARAREGVPTSWTCKRGIQSVAASPSLHLTRSWC